MKCLINGRPGSSLEVSDRGLHYGDGVFETMLVRDGRARYFSRHMRRLESGCNCLGIQAPDPSVIAGEIKSLCEEDSRAVAKLIVTRGAGERGYAPPAQAEPRRLVLAYPWAEESDLPVSAGIAVRTCSIRLGINPALAGVKHLNRLEQVLARSEWTDKRIGEGLMFDHDGFLTEGVHSNVFLVSGGRVRTPLLDRCGVAGVMRERVLEIAADAGLSTERCRLVRDDMLAADEVFLTNTLAGILPVNCIDQQRYPVGKITRRLLALLAVDLRS